MNNRKSRGMVGLPIVIILSAILASIALGLGMRGLNRARDLTEDQKINRSFDRLVEVATEASYGKVGGSEEVSLELFDGSILVEDRLVQLEVENEFLRADFLPLPLLKENRRNFSIRSGSFSIKLAYLADDSSDGIGSSLVLILMR